MSGKLFDDLGDLVGHLINKTGWASKEASKLVINGIIKQTRHRPHPWSTASDYTSWKGLTDRTYQARHLQAEVTPVQPDLAKVAQLFARPNGEQVLSQKSTCLFPAFAQYLTDGFLRTDPKHRDRTTSNHEIDLCPLYGRLESQTDILREKSSTPGRLGRLKTQVIDGEEYPPFLYEPDGKAIKAEFLGLDEPLGTASSDEHRASLFAIGGDRANATPFTAMMNTLFLREHNRIARELETRNPGWDDEHVFQVARNILIPMFIKIVVEQYINHITPLPFNLVTVPEMAWEAPWNRPNWMTAEFSLLYRWHSLMPDTIVWADGTSVPLADFPLNNLPLIKFGLAQAFTAAAAQPAAELGALNTNAALMQVEGLAIDQARTNKLTTYNKYRQAFGMDPARSFEDISSDRRIQTLLHELYEKPDNVEFYPGLFAEDRVKRSPLPSLLLRMVAVDAFSQALTNPLLSEHVFNEATFTPWGLAEIENTRSLADLLQRQGAVIDPKLITMTQRAWHYRDVP